MRGPNKRFSVSDLVIPAIAALSVFAYMTVTWLRGGDVRWKSCVYAGLIVAGLMVAARLCSHLWIRLPRTIADAADADGDLPVERI